MGKKKSKEPPTVAGSDTVTSQTDIFTSIFGNISEPNAAVSSLFSDENPFKRKPFESIENPNLGSTEEGAETKKSKKAKTPKDANLGSLDTNVEKNETLESPNGQYVKRKKRKRDEVEKEYEEKKYGTLALTETADVKEDVVLGQKRKKPEDVGVVSSEPKEGFDDESKLLRTVFVGNLPLKVKKKVLIKEFSKFGEVDSVRIRSVPLNDTKKPRKGAIMLKQINDKIDSVNAYIVFKTEQSAEASLAHNMAVVAGNHVRVDRACPPRKKLKADSTPLYDNKRTVFVGNLPFDVKDEEVYRLFCGINNLESSIEAVRVVRDPHLGVGKGIAYVLFKTREGASSVVKKRKLKLRDRELRLSHAKADATPSKRKNLSSSGTDSSTPAKRFAVDTNSSLSYQGMRASKSGSKSGVEKKKPRTQSSIGPVRMNFKAQRTEKTKERIRKRPSVAARKAKANAQRDGSSPRKQTGIKRKLDSFSPGSSSRHKKKDRKFR